MPKNICKKYIDLFYIYIILRGQMRAWSSSIAIYIYIYVCVCVYI